MNGKYRKELQTLQLLIEKMQREGTLESGQSSRLKPVLGRLKAATTQQHVQSAVGELASIFIREDISRENRS